MPCHLTAMCGRYTHLLTRSKIVELYRLTLPDEEPKGLTPNYNVAPTTVMPIVRPAGNGRELVMAGWGAGPVLAEARATGQAALQRRPALASASLARRRNDENCRHRGEETRGRATETLRHSIPPRPARPTTASGCKDGSSKPR
jgi:hypothetical protein